MKNSLKAILIVLLLTSFSSKAQSPAIDWAMEQPTHNKDGIYQIFLGNDNSIFVIRKQDGVYRSIAPSYFIEKYERETYNFKFIQELIVPEYEGKKVEFSQIAFVGKKLYAFLKSNNDNKTYCFASEINQNTGTLGSLIKIDEIISPKKNSIAYFDIVTNINSSKVLICHHEFFNKYANESFTCFVLDENLKKIYDAKLTFPYLDKNMDISNYSIDEEGNIFMINSIEKTGIDKDSESPDKYDYKITAYYYKTKETKEYSIDLGDKIISNISFRLSPNNSLVIAGFYSNKSSSGFKGVYYLTLDKQTKTMSKLVSKEFSPSFMANFISEKDIKKGKEPTRFLIDRIVFASSGEIFIISEQRYLRMKCQTDPKTYRSICYYSYYSHSIVVSKINKSGQFEWDAIVPKYQKSEGTNLYSYYCFSENRGKLYFLYNENPKNLKKTNPLDFDNFNFGKGGAIVMASVNEKGEVTREVMTPAVKSRAIFTPDFNVKLENGDVLLYSLSRKKIRFGKLSFK